MRGLAALTVVLLVAQPAFANPSRNAKDALDQGRTAYDRGDYGRAIDTINPLLYPSIELGTEDEVVAAHKLLALSYFFVNKQKDAENEVTSLLALRPNYQLDPIVDPPVAVRFFDDVRHRQSERLNALKKRELEETERAHKEEERRLAEARAKAERIYVDRVVEKHSRLIALLPFGAGQAQNGQTGKAIAFGVSEGVFALASVVSYFTLQYRYPINPATGHQQFPASDQSTATALLSVQLAAGAAFWATLAWGIIDAQVLFKREVVVETHERTTPPPPLPPKKQKHSWMLVPSPGGVGVVGSF
jgi:hypothetical protein